MTLTHDYFFRAKYSETDKMGFVHHSNYIKYFENARWEMFRELGISYFKLEKEGYYMPVIEIESKFIKPVFYDDEIKITTIITKIPSVKMEFSFELSSKSGELLNRAKVVCAFIDSKTGKVRRAPNLLLEKLV